MECGSHTASSISHRTVKDREVGRGIDEGKKEYVDEENR
jgi:hypothetical protein